LKNDAFDKTGRFLTALLRLLPPETAHQIGIKAMEHGLLKIMPRPRPYSMPVPLHVTLPGIGRLRHPVGLAAGFDKNASCPGAFEWLGCSFLEIGTVTPKPQPGNPKPRLFRYPETMSMINRMGFNSDGAEAVIKRLQKINWSPSRIPLGINVGKNKNTPPDRAIDDFAACINAFSEFASWLTINISSPNTPGLRDLATVEFIRDLAQAIGTLRSKCWIKLDPDMNRTTFQTLIATISEEGFQGVVLSNTHRVEWPQSGGQSGHPLLSQSNQCLEWAWTVTNGKLPMIATGGVISGIDAFQKLIRGASAVQIYTALVYRGPGAVQRICEELSEELKLRGFSSAEDCIGSLYQ
jgi:dihydroorotate dehydrogenase